MSWCRQRNAEEPQGAIASIVGGVARTNLASKRVLVKNGFRAVCGESQEAHSPEDQEEEEFCLQLLS